MPAPCTGLGPPCRGRGIGSAELSGTLRASLGIGIGIDRDGEVAGGLGTWAKTGVEWPIEMRPAARANRFAHQHGCIRTLLDPAVLAPIPSDGCLSIDRRNG